MNSNLISYYSERAKEYDKVYQIPYEQKNLEEAKKIFQKLFSNKSVLEIACGTGYWTEQLSAIAKSILATDINESMIEIAKNRCDFDNVTFELVNMFDLTTETKYDALFGGFIWSHILLQDIDAFITQTKSYLNPNGIIAFIDTKQVNNTAHELKRITKTDEQGNTYQTRVLENGTRHLVLKNYPTQDFIFQKLSKISTDIQYIDMDYYWIAVCKIKI